VRVGPDDVNVKPVDQVSCPDVALQLDGALDGGELVPHLNVLIVHYAICCHVPYAVWLEEGEVQLHFPRVTKPAVLGMERLGKELVGVVRRDWTVSQQSDGKLWVRVERRDGQQRTEMLQYLARITALPHQAAWIGPYDLPGAEIHSHFTRRPLE
jgi:hypothetical protein